MATEEFRNVRVEGDGVSGTLDVEITVDDMERWRWTNGLQRKPEMVHKNPDAPITAEQSEMMDPFYKMWVEGVK